ncbi:hypothetical protein [Amycolatopsis sp. SID8362]|uniref:hypothetical protein n=1 Tax=Amycolatopsis sp. SID8362 TaxID=2690346 RepID=UPI00136AAA3A|nr:hypothetical protein [Amycolatopsis sp. SID8362]NBH02269.1 hypothetical protein [Amycolatopsis sp. SID8362]NED38972.1 hypothetical protein [Amycolatopsis sp. SID8362]
MSEPDNTEFLHGLEIEVEAELDIAESSHFEDAARTPVSEWQFDPTDAERYEVNLRGLLGAVEAVEDGERGHR